MLKERPLFFKEIKFKELTADISGSANSQVRTDQEVAADNPLIFDSVTGIPRYDRPLWTKDGIIDDFFDNLKQLRASGIRIPIYGRSVFLVRREALVPDSEGERRKLKDKYGDNILDSIIGDNSKIEEERFISRIGYRDQEHVALPSEVMQVIAHEHGHTIGDLLPPVWEEMKAYAFEGFFMSSYLKKAWEIDGTDPKSLHEIARNRVAQLTQRGIAYLEILSHLAGYGFGEFDSRDYSKHVGVRGKLRGKITRHAHS